MKRSLFCTLRIALIAIIPALLSCGKSNSEPTKPKDVAVTSVTLNQVSIELKVGESVQLTATIQPSNATSKTITWSSSNSAVASIANGLLTAIGEGTATITASAGGKSANCNVTVKQNVVTVQSIELNKTSLPLTKGSSETLIATVKPDNATDKSVIWSSVDSQIATVDQNGKVTAISNGTTKILATAGEKSAQCEVIVTVPVESLVIEPDELSIDLGQSGSLSAIIKPDDATDKTIKWESKNSNIATVTNEGLVSGVSLGETTITATCGNITAECKIKIIDPLEKPIPFVDESLKTRLVAFYDTNHDNELSFKEASAVKEFTNIPDLFGPDESEKPFTSFNEFKYFTGIESLPYHCFSKWNSLTGISLPTSLNKIVLGAFNGTNSANLENLYVESLEQLLSIDYVQPSGFSVAGPAGILLHGYLYISGQKINKLVIPSGTKIIKSYTCQGLKISEVDLPESLISIGDYAFSYCGFESLVLPQKIESIGSYAFRDFYNLKSVKLSNGIKDLGAYAFYECVSLSEVELPNNLSIIPSGLFHSSGIKSITIPEGYEKIESYAFYDCNKLNEIILPKSLNEISYYAFANNNSLTKITCHAITPPILPSSKIYFNLQNQNLKIYVPAASVNSYKEAQGWKEYADRIQAIE